MPEEKTQICDEVKSQFRNMVKYADKYPGSRQLITLPAYPQVEQLRTWAVAEGYKLPIVKHQEDNSNCSKIVYANNSVVEVGLLEDETDCRYYGCIDYDTIRISESQRYSEYVHKFMTTRLRGAESRPRRLDLF